MIICDTHTNRSRNFSSLCWYNYPIETINHQKQNETHVQMLWLSYFILKKTNNWVCNPECYSFKSTDFLKNWKMNNIDYICNDLFIINGDHA